MHRDCQHPTLSLMRSGPDVSGSCIKCWKSVIKTKEVIAWKYGLVGYREKKQVQQQQQQQQQQNEPSSSQRQGSITSCEHKILKIYRSDRYVAARCMHCDTLITSVSELRLIRSAIIKPRIDLGASPIVRGKQKLEPSVIPGTPEISFSSHSSPSK